MEWGGVGYVFLILIPAVPLFHADQILQDFSIKVISFSSYSYVEMNTVVTMNMARW